MATHHDLDRLRSAGLWTSDPTKYPGLRTETRVGDDIAIRMVPMEYRTERDQLAFCYVCGRRNHNHGFVAVLEDQTAVLIGNCCADRLVNQTELLRAKAVLARRKAAVHYEGLSAKIVGLLDQLDAVVGEYASFCVGADDRFDRLRESCRDQFSELYDVVRRHGPRLVTTEVIVSTSTQLKRHAAKHRYVDKEVGTLRGTKFFLARKRLGGLQYSIAKSISSLAKVTAHDSANRPEAERLVSRFRLEVQEPAALLDDLAVAASSFLTLDNFRVVDTWLQHESAIGEDRPLARLALRSNFIAGVESALKIPLKQFVPRLSSTIESGLAAS